MDAWYCSLLVVEGKEDPNTCLSPCFGWRAYKPTSMLDVAAHDFCSVFFVASPRARLLQGVADTVAGFLIVG